MRRNHFAQPPPRVDKPVCANSEDAEQRRDRSPAQPVVGAFGGRQPLLQLGVLFAAHFADHGADAVHGGLAAVRPHDRQRACGVAAPVKRDRFVDFGKLFVDRRAQRLELRLPLRVRTPWPRRSPPIPRAGPPTAER